MFASIADRYDLVNTVLSLGNHYRWRKKTVALSEPADGMSVLDCATGTGDLALDYKKVVGKDGRVLGTDFCEEMIAPAPAKAERKNLVVEFEVADAMNLPYEDDTFDISSIAFGIRNVDDPSAALKEMARVVKTGGKVVVLEFGQPYGIMKHPFKFYSKYIMPTVGGGSAAIRKLMNICRKPVRDSRQEQSLPKSWKKPEVLHRSVFTRLPVALRMSISGLLADGFLLSFEIQQIIRLDI